MFYLIVNLHHRAVYVQKNYRYLSSLEEETRNTLCIDSKKRFFTRESEFYWSDRSASLGAVKFVHILILLSLLVLFFSCRLVDTQQLLRPGTGLNIVLGLIDGFIAVVTFYFFPPILGRRTLGTESLRRRKVRPALSSIAGCQRMNWDQR